MDSEGTKKRRPVLTIVSAVLFTTFLIASIAFFILFFSRAYMGYIYAAMIFMVGFGIASFVLTIVSHKDRIKKAMIPLLISTIVIGVADLFGALLALLRGGIEEGQNNYIHSVIAQATIEKAMKAVPEKGMTLYAPEIKDSPYRYFDDGPIAAKFKSLEFAVTSYGYYKTTRFERPSSMHFELRSDMDVCFSNDPEYSYVTVRYFDGGRLMSGGPVLAWRDYSVPMDDLNELKAMISDRIGEQKAAYETKEAEEKAKLTFPLVFESFSEAGREMLFTYYDKENQQANVERQKDEEKEILQILETMDTSSWRALESGDVYGQRGFYYWSTGEVPYMLRYCADNRVVSIQRNYEDPYGGARGVYAYFELGEEDGRTLMDAVAKLASEKN